MKDNTPQGISTHPYMVNLEEGQWKSPSVAVVTTVAELSEREIERLDPLHKSVDPDAFDDVFSRSTEASTRCRLRFRYQGYRIELIGERQLRFTPVEKLVTN